MAMIAVSLERAAVAVMTTVLGKGRDDEDGDNNNNQLFELDQITELLIDHVLGWILCVRKGSGGGDDDDIVRQGHGR